MTTAFSGLKSPASQYGPTAISKRPSSRNFLELQRTIHPVPGVSMTAWYGWVDPPAPVPVVLRQGARRPDNATQNGFRPWDEGADVPPEDIGEKAARRA